MSKVSGGAPSTMLKGLTNRSPPASDSSTKMPAGKNVAADATRSTTAQDIPGETAGRTA